MNNGRKTAMGGGHMGGGRRGPMIAEKPKDMKGTVKRLLRYIGRNKALLIVMIIGVMITSAVTLISPTMQTAALDYLTPVSIGGKMEITEGIPHVDMGEMLRILVILGALFVASSLFTLIQGRLAAKLSQGTVRVMRNDLFARMAKLPIGYTDHHPHGDIMSRMTNDIESIANTISQSITSLLSGLITIIGALCIMLFYSPEMTLVSVLTIPMTLLATSFLTKRVRKYFAAQQALLGELNARVEESVMGYRTILAFSHEGKAKKEFFGTCADLKKTGIRAEIFGGLMGPLMNVIGNIGYLLIVVAGVIFAVNGRFSVTTVFLFIRFSKQFTRPLSEIANQYTNILNAVTGAERVFAIMDEPSEIDEGKTELIPEKITGELQFSHVDFSYFKEKPVLRDFCLDVKAGQKIAIVGKTGSGKTTIINLLTRFYEIDRGQILLDGVDIRDITKDTLRQNIAIVLQDTVLFSDTVEANIRYGRPDATEQEIREAALTANADSFIRRMPNGYQTVLTEAGGNISSGQRQLLTIARAVLASPKILILDEATSGVDTRTELHIQEAMMSLMEGRTTLVIAHRLSTIRDADSIIVLEGGKICEAGDHETLLAKKGVYYNLYMSQFAGIKT